MPTRAEEIYQFINNYVDSHHASPTMKEIQDKFGYKSDCGVDYQLRILEQRGKIQRHPGKRKAISVINKKLVVPKPEVSSRLPEEYHQLAMYIYDHLRTYGYSPTVNELSAHFKHSKTTILRRLDKLQRERIIYRPKGRVRSILLRSKGE
jgi:SOS-response transcriptional repressor LexA